MGSLLDPALRSRVHTTRIGGDPAALAVAAGRLAVGLGRRPARVARLARRRLDRGLRAGLRSLLIDAVLLTVEPDVVHFEFVVDARHRVDLGAVLDRPLSASVRGFDVNIVGLDRPDFYRDVFTALSAVHCLGEDLWRRARERGCPPELPHALIAPAIDADFFVPPERDPVVVGPPRRPLRIASVGRLHWKKGHPDGLAAVRRLVDAGVTVEHRIVGAGGEADEVRATVEALDLGGHVALLGPAPREVVRDTLAWADVMLHPSVSEGFANAVLEAQAMEVPVVCTDADGLAENVVDGVTGDVVARRDAAAMADRLAALAADPDRRRRMGRAGRERVLAHFTPDRQIDAFLAFYRDLRPTAESSRWYSS